MRKSITVLFVSVFAFGYSLQNNYPLGTSEAEFTKKNKMFIEVAEKSSQRTVYKKTLPGNSYLYYYFVDEKLVRIDEGQLQPNVVIERVNGTY
ncbi:hypothetical protein [Mucilaginibacter sp.]|uniref:hypothetical protein n=1 Tax=Mucilaginibacter sp. TaxID=1882438 RepID=UPI000CC5CDC0|nr:hypothetical protein [Mucilaginibacter sp.]PLW89453.1 MAG: hypothetical protein C0154_11470 [Mucilaginibacter sp.]HEK19121.1 hypothetical protein [Bacteroidota bacterium]